MVVDDDGRFLTQRELPRLALVSVEVTARAPCALPRRTCAPCDVPLDARGALARRRRVAQRPCAASTPATPPRRGCPIGSRTTFASSASIARVTRDCNREYAGDSGAHTMFADGYPILVANVASLRELNDAPCARGHRALPMNRFRPNVVIDGLPAFDEDHVDTIAIGDVVLRLVKPCTRCQVTTTDQDTARVGIEPLRTLGEFRMDEKLDGVTFGMNAIVVEGDGSDGRGRRRRARSNTASSALLTAPRRT